MQDIDCENVTDGFTYTLKLMRFFLASEYCTEKHREILRPALTKLEELSDEWDAIALSGFNVDNDHMEDLLVRFVNFIENEGLAIMRCAIR